MVQKNAGLASRMMMWASQAEALERKKLADGKMRQEDAEIAEENNARRRAQLKRKRHGVESAV